MYLSYLKYDTLRWELARRIRITNLISIILHKFKPIILKYKSIRKMKVNFHICHVAAVLLK